VLAYGERAVLSHGTALAAWGLRDTLAVWVDVTVATDAGVRHRPGTRLFRHRDLRPEEITTWRGIPITTVPRALLDGAAILARHVLRRAVEAAFRKHGVTVEVMRRLLAAHPGREGVPALRAIVDDFASYGVTFTRSVLESLILELCLDGGLPRPEINRVREREIDCRWPDHGLIVELDGYETHQGRAKFVADRARNRQHVLRGETILAYTHWDLVDEPVRVVAEIRAVLERLAS
jgi:very-short-patch-repair endonuclease